MPTDVSPLLNFLSSHSAGLVPSRSQIASTRDGCEDPEKILIWRIAIGRSIATSEIFMGGIQSSSLIGEWRIPTCIYSCKAAVERLRGRERGRLMLTGICEALKSIRIRPFK